ncbi:MAG: DUF1329 domain-containing protein [Dissulfuribacterales bacterium]
MRYTLKSKSYLLIGVICLMMVFGSSVAWAELKAGTVINADNIDQMKPQKFEGKTIASMLPEKIEWWIRNHGLNITLRHSEPYPVDPLWIKATEKYSKYVKFDTKTRDVSGYKAGLAFPNISDDDPYKAEKLIWNMYLTGGWPRPTYQFIPRFVYLMIDGKRGIERTMTWAFLRVWMTGRLNGDPVIGDGNIYYKQIVEAREPYDIRGLGTFRKRYIGGKLDDGWAYLRSVRRTRRISGGAWSDPIGGTDQLNDELTIFSAYPAWFPKYKYLGKRYILAVAHSPVFPWQPGSSNPYPCTDSKNPPYWNPIAVWEPKEVYVIEASMPEEHVFSKRIYYCDVKAWVPYFSEAYDKRGDFTKINMLQNKVIKGMDSPTSVGVMAAGIYTYDFKRMHATLAYQGPMTRRNPPGMGERDVSLSIMEAIAEGKWHEPEFEQPPKGKLMYLKDFDIDWKTLKLK